MLRLDCPVSQLVGGQRAGVMLWKKGHRVLTAGTIKVGTRASNERRFHNHREGPYSDIIAKQLATFILVLQANCIC